jgi:hypothetical protein
MLKQKLNFEKQVIFYNYRSISVRWQIGGMMGPNICWYIFNVSPLY